MTFDLDEYKTLYLQTSRDLASLLLDVVNSLSIGVNEPDILKEARRHAHSLKSQSLVMGYTSIADASLVLEMTFLYILTSKQNLTETAHTKILSLTTKLSQQIDVVADGTSVSMDKEISALQQEFSIGSLPTQK